MKTTIRRMLVIASVLGVVSVAGLVLARPSPARKPDAAAKQKSGDSLQITMTTGKGRLGVSTLQISPELRVHFGAPEDRGVLVDAVRADSPAAKAGLRVGDVIVQVDGDATESASDILEAMADRDKGETVSIAVMREHSRIDLAATLQEDASTTRMLGSADLDQHLGQWLREMTGPALARFGDADLQRKLEDMTRRMDALEKRLDKQTR